MSRRLLCFILLALLCLETKALKPFDSVTFNTMVKNKQYAELLQNICPIRKDCGNYFIGQMTTKNVNPIVILEDSELGRTDFNCGGEFYLKSIVYTTEEMALYSMSEVNLGLKFGAQHVINQAQNVMAIDDCCFDSYKDGIVTKYRLSVRTRLINGGKLKEILANDQMKTLTNSFAWRFNIIAGLIEGISLFHKYGYAHRDINTDTIQIENFHTPILTDYLYSSKIGNGAKAFTVVGTPLYLAPEVFSDLGYSQSADIYSAGLVIFEIFNVPKYKVSENLQTDVQNACGVNIDPIMKIKDSYFYNYCTFIHPLVALMTNLEPTRRINYEQLMEKLRAHLFRTTRVSLVPT